MEHLMVFFATEEEMMEFLYQRQDEIVSGIQAFFAEQVEQNTAATKRQVEQELESLYVRFGNDWTGRGIVGDTIQMATIAGLEAVRAACLERLEH
jgi:proteasome assembly chaperone (PAC2) family protein